MAAHFSDEFKLGFKKWHYSLLYIASEACVYVLCTAILDHLLMYY